MTYHDVFFFSVSHVVQVCLEDGEATVQRDKDGILFEMAGHADLSTPEGQNLLQQNLKGANDALHSTFAILAWPQAMKHGSLLDFAKDKGRISWVSLCFFCLFGGLFGARHNY